MSHSSGSLFLHLSKGEFALSADLIELFSGIKDDNIMLYGGDVELLRITGSSISDIERFIDHYESSTLSILANDEGKLLATPLFQKIRLLILDMVNGSHDVYYGHDDDIPALLILDPVTKKVKELIRPANGIIVSLDKGIAPLDVRNKASKGWKFNKVRIWVW